LSASSRFGDAKLIFGEHLFLAHTWRGAMLDSDLCRICHVAAETPEHALLQCRAHQPTEKLREDFLLDLHTTRGFHAPSTLSNDAAAFWLRKLIFNWELVIPTARFIHLHYLIWSGETSDAPSEVSWTGLIDEGDDIVSEGAFEEEMTLDMS
jgi:hypothetical protein